MAFLEHVLDTIFPIYCLDCCMRGEYLCPNCLSRCPKAQREVQPWIFPLFDYRHPPIRKAVWFIKYKGKKKLTRIFGELMYEQIIEELGDLSRMENFRSPILVPIPLSKERKRKRGFNQAEILCKEIMKIDQEKYLTLDTEALIKPKETRHQAHAKNKAERQKNLLGTFAATKGLENRNVILIDDVATTGATLLEARKVLKEAGARKVIAFTIAH
jgi:competence protein ComFC